MTPEEIEEMINQSIANFVNKYEKKRRLIKIFILIFAIILSIKILSMLTN